MTRLRRSPWVTWPVMGLLFTACVFPPPPPSLSPERPSDVPSAQQSEQPLPRQASGATPVLIPTNTPGTVNSPANALTLAQQQLLAGLPSLGAAPELQNEIWFNSDPLHLVDLRGKVVMVEFWTYG